MLHFMILSRVVPRQPKAKENAISNPASNSIPSNGNVFEFKAPIARAISSGHASSTSFASGSLNNSIDLSESFDTASMVSDSTAEGKRKRKRKRKKKNAANGENGGGDNVQCEEITMKGMSVTELLQKQGLCRSPTFEPPRYVPPKSNGNVHVR